MKYSCIDSRTFGSKCVPGAFRIEVRLPEGIAAALKGSVFIGDAAFFGPQNAVVIVLLPETEPFGHTEIHGSAVSFEEFRGGYSEMKYKPFQVFIR
jgi:hypothetical protein